MNKAKKYISDKRYLQKEFNEISKGKVTYHSIEDLEKNLEKIIKKHEVNKSVKS